MACPHSHLVRAAALALALTTLTPAAVAGQGEHLLSLRGDYAFAESHGGGVDLGWMWGIDDFWNLTADVGWVYLPLEPEVPQHVLNVSTGTVYHLDAFQWIPYLAVDLGLYVGLPQDTDVEPGVAFGFGFGGGVDYRPARRWAIGVFVRYHLIVTGDVPSHLEAGLRANIYF